MTLLSDLQFLNHESILLAQRALDILLQCHAAMPHLQCCSIQVMMMMMIVNMKDDCHCMPRANNRRKIFTIDNHTIN
jgi:hypothetical protein